MHIQIDSEPLNRIERTLNAMTSERVKRAIAMSVVGTIKMNFRNQVAPDGTQWTPLKEATIRARRLNGQGAKIMRDTGNLLSSLNSKIESDSVVVGFNANYADFHDSGTRHIPQRRLLPTVSRELDMDEITDIIARAINA